MGDFPRTKIDNLSMPRLVIGTNWFLGFSHQTKAKDKFILEHQTRERLADTLEVFMAAGCDAIFGVRPESPELNDAIRDAEDRTGRACIRMGTPYINVNQPPESDGNKREIDKFVELGCQACFPHQCTTDALVDRRTHVIRDMDKITALIRERGMIPGLSAHSPEAVTYADAADLDVATYIQIYNAAGFLMQVEVDWVHRIIWKAKKPVMTIKPLAAGRLPPLVGLAFNWATIRPQDMVLVGCLTPDEAREVIDISLAQLEGRRADGELQKTRSKKSLTNTND